MFTFYEQYAGGTRFQTFTRVLNKVVFEMEATFENVTSLMLLLRPTNRTVIVKVMASAAQSWFHSGPEQGLRDESDF